MHYRMLVFLGELDDVQEYLGWSTQGQLGHLCSWELENVQAEHLVSPTGERGQVECLLWREGDSLDSDWSPVLFQICAVLSFQFSGSSPWLL